MTLYVSRQTPPRNLHHKFAKFKAKLWNCVLGGIFFCCILVDIYVNGPLILTVSVFSYQQTKHLDSTGESSGRHDGGLGSILESLEEFEEVKDIYTVDTVPSLSVFLGEAIDSIKSQLVRDITTDIFLDVEGKDKDKFEDSYTLFVASVHRLESNICNYIKVKGELYNQVYLGSQGFLERR